MALLINRILCILQALLFAFSVMLPGNSDFAHTLINKAAELTGVTDMSFEKITSEEIKVTEAEKRRCREWYENNVLSADKMPAYDFTVGGKSFRKNPEDWSFSVGEESAVGAVRRGGKTTVITASHKKSGLKAEIEATIYEDFATCEWTVYIRNDAGEKSPVINNFYAADCDIAAPGAELYVSRGSDCSADDFELIKMPVNTLPMIFKANEGRSGDWLPYFNISGENGGAVASVGWTGQWYTEIKQNRDSVRFNARQQYFRAYLDPEEQVRSPLVSLTFYDGTNALKGFNTFRNWESACVYTESAFPLTCTVIAGEFDRRNTDDYIQQINSFDDFTCSTTDFLWRDAGWYKINGDWYDSVGNWSADPERFPDGFAPIADAAQARGMKFLLWYEPERCCKNTTVYDECIKHEGWLIERSDNVNMVNLACDGACDFLGELVANSIKENKVGLYRQDFNFEPLPLWEEADKELWNGRKGIEENHYVTNLYRFLDTLLEVNPGLIIDNCASGGRRLDTEMSRRSIPLWRTDYNCSASDGTIHDDCIEATQSASYGVSFWLPLTGTGLNIWNNKYGERSLITPCTQRAGYEDIRSFMDKNYYPLTYGGLELDCFHAMQFGDEKAGTALIYKRENAAENVYHLELNGLSENSQYEIYDYDTPEKVTTVSGAALMSGGIDITVSDTPGAAIILYTEKL